LGAGAVAEPPRAGLRRLAARGTLVNGAFDVSLTSLGLIKGFVVAAFLTRADYGVYGILAAALGTLLWLKQAGIGDRYVQQREDDQERAFQVAFTLELALSGLFALLILLVVPVIALVYGEDQLLAPGLVLSAAVIGVALQTPVWPYYRSMDFFRQRLLQSVDPLVAFVVTVVLAALDAGYWALVIGIVAGAFAGALAAVLASPFPLRLRWEPGALRSYASFSMPLIVAGLAGVVIAQSATLVSELELGLAGVGAVALASSIIAYTGRVDQVVTNTLYPAICAVRDRREALVEAFLKSNRLALSFGLPFGVGLALFAEPLIDDVLGSQWRPALGLIQAFALLAAADQLGFNWTAFQRAVGNTRPIAVVTVVMMVVFLAVAIPLLLTEGLRGLAIGMACTTATGLAGRWVALRRLFGPLPLGRLALRSLVPSALGAGIVLALSAPAIPELLLFACVVAGLTWLLQGGLLREALGYLARRSSAQAEPATRPA
jgi:O-antigen/teichoic acid export membrane protein